MANSGKENPYKSPSAPAEGGTKGSLLVVFLTVFIDLLGFGIVLPLLPIYGKEFASQHGYSPRQTGIMIGLLMASFSAMQFLFMPIWGRLSDRIGRRPVLMIGLCGSTLFYFMFGLATVWRSLTGLFIARIGAGIAGATISTAQAYIADVTTKEKRAKGMALIGAAFALGFMLGPLLGIVSLLPGLQHLGFGGEATADQSQFSPWPGFLASLFSGLALLLAAFKLKESWRPGAAHAERKLFDPVALRAALATPSIALLLLTSFIAVFSFACFESTLALQVKQMVNDADPSETAPPESPQVDQQAVVVQTHPIKSTSPLLASLIAKAKGWGYRQENIVLVVGFMIFAYLGIVLTLAQGFLVRRLADRISEATMCMIGGTLAIIGFSLLALATTQDDFGLFVGAMTIEVTGFAFVNPSLQALISRRSDPARQGGVLGLSQSASSLARICGPGVGPPLLLSSLPASPYFLASGLMAVGLAMVIVAARRGEDYASG